MALRLRKGAAPVEPHGARMDHELDRPPRRCANCGKAFKPTICRRLLCASCFAGKTDPHGATAFEG